MEPQPTATRMNHFFHSKPMLVVIVIWIVGTAFRGAKAADLANLPPALQEVIVKKLGVLVVDEIETEREDNSIVYKIHGTANGAEVELEISETGTILKLNQGDDERHFKNGGPEIDEDAYPNDLLPGPVWAALKSVAPGLTIFAIESETKGFMTYYEIKGSRNGKAIEVKITPQGSVLKIEFEGAIDDEEFLSIDQLPETLRDAIKDLFTDPIITKAQRKMVNARFVYDIVGYSAYRLFELQIAADGNVLKRHIEDYPSFPDADDDDIHFEALPDAVRRALVVAYPDLEVFEIAVHGQGENTRYEIEGASGSQQIEVLLTSAGEIVNLTADSDNDGLDDIREADSGTDPENPDTDGDLFPDGFEVDRGVSATDHDAVPNILQVVSMHGTHNESLNLTVDTPAGAMLQIERCPDGLCWAPVGSPFPGDGKLIDFVVPIGERNVELFRVRIDKATGKPPIPPSLTGVAMEITLAGKKQTLCFKNNHAGDIPEHKDDGTVEFEPFEYTFKKTGPCTAKLILRFPGVDGDEVITLELTFGDDNKGAFARIENDPDRPEVIENGRFEWRQEQFVQR